MDGNRPLGELAGTGFDLTTTADPPAATHGVEIRAELHGSLEHSGAISDGAA